MTYEKVLRWLYCALTFVFALILMKCDPIIGIMAYILWGIATVVAVEEGIL